MFGPKDVKLKKRDKDSSGIKDAEPEKDSKGVTARGVPTKMREAWTS